MNEKQDDRRVRKTKKALRDGFAVLLAQKNIKDISVRELTDLADLHRGTFYLHYRDIYDLYANIEEEMVSDVVNILDAYRFKPGESPFPLILELINYLAENAQLCRSFLSRNGDMAFVEHLSDLIRRKCLSDWLDLYRGGSNDTQRFEFFSAFLVSGCVGVLRHWLDTGMLQNPKEISELLEQMATQVISALSSSKT